MGGPKTVFWGNAGQLFADRYRGWRVIKANSISFLTDRLQPLRKGPPDIWARGKICPYIKSPIFSSSGGLQVRGVQGTYSSGRVLKFINKLTRF